MVRLKPAGTASPSASTRADTTGLFALLRFISLASKVLSELLSPQPPSLVDCAVTEDELKSVRASEREAAVTSLMRLICVVVVAGSATNEFVASSLLENARAPAAVPTRAASEAEARIWLRRSAARAASRMERRVWGAISLIFSQWPDQAPKQRRRYQRIAPHAQHERNENPCRRQTMPSLS